MDLLFRHYMAALFGKCCRQPVPAISMFRVSICVQFLFYDKYLKIITEFNTHGHVSTY
jgi:hypothetical protein